MAARGAKGSICARFYDGDGAMLHSEQDACTLSIDLDKLALAPTKFGVAFGPDKVTAIFAAIRGRLLNHLASDSETADALIRLAASQPAAKREGPRGASSGREATGMRHCFRPRMAVDGREPVTICTNKESGRCV